jgi:hypothetical protein
MDSYVRLNPLLLYYLGHNVWSARAPAFGAAGAMRTVYFLNF